MLVANLLRTNRIKIFSAGTKRDRFGRVRNWGVEELQKAADSYDPELLRADVLIGHDSHDSRGWIAKAYLEGENLYCDYGEIDHEFAQEVNLGYYKKRSVSFLPPQHPENPDGSCFYIRHLAYVAIPAEKGMPDHQFEEGGEDEWDFVEIVEDKIVGAIALPILREGEKNDIDIAQIVSTYNPTHHEAPVLIEGGGEHKAYGWVKGLLVDNGDGVAQIESVNDQFAESLRQGSYKERVVECYSPNNPSNPTPGKWSLRQIVLKGVADFGEGEDYEFGDEESGETMEVSQFSEKTLNYAEIGWRAFNAMGAIASLLGRQRDRTIESEGVDAADADYPQALLDMILREGDNNYVTFEAMQSILRDYDQRVSMLQDQVWRLQDALGGSSPSTLSSYEEAIDMSKEELTALSARIQVLEEGAKRAASDREQRDAVEFVEGLVANFQVRASEKEGWVQQLLASPNREATISYGEGTLTPRDALKCQLSALPRFFDNRRLKVGAITASGELSSSDYAEAEGVTPESASADSKIRRIMQEKSCSYGEAYAIARQQGGLIL